MTAQSSSLSKIWRGSPGPGKAGEARAARADAPGRQRDAEGGDLLRDRFGLEAPARQHAPQVIVILDQSGGGLFVGLGDETGVDGEAHGDLCSTLSRHCESEATKQPRGYVTRPLGCFVAALLAMTG